MATTTKKPSSAQAWIDSLAGQQNNDYSLLVQVVQSGQPVYSDERVFEILGRAGKTIDDLRRDVLGGKSQPKRTSARKATA